MKDRTLYAVLAPVCAIAAGVGFATVRPTPVSNTAQIVVTINAPAIDVPDLQWPTATNTPNPTPTTTPWPTDVPLPTWGGQQEDQMFVIPAETPTALPPFVHQVCLRATPVRSSDMSCLGVPFPLPGGWFG